MSSKTGFIAGLNKSTKITVWSCVGFILLTCIILVFFILFPITPSEKIMASIGRENVLNSGSDGSPQSVSVGVVTTADKKAPVTGAAATNGGTTIARTVNIRITTGSGFLWNGRIPTGVMPGEDYPTTPVEDPDVPTVDPGYTGEIPTIPNQGNEIPPATEPNGSGGEIPPTTTPVDPGVDPPPSVEPGNDDPPVDPPPSVEPGNDDPSVDPPPPVDPGNDDPSPDPEA